MISGFIFVIVYRKMKILGRRKKRVKSTKVMTVYLG